MRNIEPYPKKERERVIRDYLKSGLTIYKYSKRSEVAVSNSTLKRWVEKHSQAVETDLLETETPNITEQLGMVCYTFDESNHAAANHQITEELLRYRVSFPQNATFSGIVGKYSLNPQRNSRNL